MTAEQIAKLVAQCRELEAKATKGPVHALKYPDVKTWTVASKQSVASKLAEGDAKLFAFLRNNAIPLCNALEAAQKENAELTKRLEAARVALDYVKAKAVFPLGTIPEKPWSQIDSTISQLNQPLP